MKLELLNKSFSICKLADLKQLDLGQEYTFFSKTDSELSLLCLTAAVPTNALKVENGYIGIRVKGTLDFALTGILAPIAQCLAKALIPIFVVSTFDTDYIFIKEAEWQKAHAMLLGRGYVF